MSKFKAGDYVVALKDGGYTGVCPGNVYKVVEVHRTGVEIKGASYPYTLYMHNSEVAAANEKSVSELQVNEKGGMKFDAQKLRYDLMPPETLEAITQVLTYGASKYDDNNWKNVETYRYEAAMMRHFEAYRKGEILDEESGFDHLAHAATCLIFILSKRLQKIED